MKTRKRMKCKVGLFFLGVLLLSGCGDGSVTKTFEKKTEEEGYKIVDKITLEGSGSDYLDKTVQVNTFTFDDVTLYAQDIEEMKQEYEAYKQCPAGNLLVSESSCSKYVLFDWSLEGNILKNTETVDYKKARDKKDQVFYDEVVPSNKYYSMEESIKQLTDEGYKEKE